MESLRQSEHDRVSTQDPLRDGAPVNNAADRHVHYYQSEPDGDLPSPKDTSTVRHTSQKRINSHHERDGKGGVESNGSARPLPRRKSNFQPKRSMTLPGDLEYPDVGHHTPGVGLGIGVPSTLARIPRGSPRISEYSSSSDDDTFVPKPHPGLGTSSSFRHKRLQSSAAPGPSRYPGMLQIPDSSISPRTASKRRVTSTGSSPDPTARNASPLVERSNSPIRGSVPSPSHTPPIAAATRLQAIIDDSMGETRARRRSRSTYDVSPFDDRSRRQGSPTSALPDGEGGQLPEFPGPYPHAAEGTGTTTPKSARPQSRSRSRSRRNSAASARLPFAALKPRQGPHDSESSSQKAGADNAINQERVDVAKTLIRKRKQSEDHALGSHRRSMSIGPSNGLPEAAEVKNGKPGPGSEGKPKKRAPLDSMGFEGSLDTPRLELGHSSETAATLDNLLSSIDIANAMRLIQKQIVLPAGVTDEATLEPNRSTIRVSSDKQRRDKKPSEIFVPRAPPPIIFKPVSPHGEGEKVEHGSPGHVGFTRRLTRMSSSEDTHSVRSHPTVPPGNRASRLSFSSTSPSGFLGSKRHASSSNLNPSKPIFENGGSKSPSNSKTGDHKRSISERFSLSHHLMPHGKKAKSKEVALQPEVNDEAVTEAKDLANLQERIQSALLELSHHPRAEKLAYQARSYLQAYYSNVYASLRSQEYDPDSVPPHNPLAVIRWRKDVRAEDAKRRAYDAAARPSVRALSQGSATGSPDTRKDTSLLSLNSPEVPSAHDRPLSKPLHSAELLNRIEQNDTWKQLKRSPALRQWVVTPSETAAYINCAGVVDRFNPPAQNGGHLWGDMPRIDRSPSTMTASSKGSRSIVSPSSRAWPIRSPPIGHATHTPSSNGTEGNGETRRGSVDTGERIASAIKSPLRSIRRQFHPHHDFDGQAIMTSDTENEAGRHIRRYALVTTAANRFRMKVHGSKEEIHQVENVADPSHESPLSSAGQVVEQKEANGIAQINTLDDVQEVSLPPNSQDTSARTSARSDVFDIMPTEEEDEAYRQKIRTLHSVEIALNRTPDVERETEAVVEDFISMVNMFSIERRCSMVQDDLDRARALKSAYVTRKLLPDASTGFAVKKMSKPLEPKEDVVDLPDKSQAQNASNTQVISIDPLNAVKDIISDLHDRYDFAVRQALDVCRKQDDVQRKASELLPDAEHLLSQIGDRVRKLRGIRESFYTLDAIQSSNNPAYYRVVNAGISITGWTVQLILLVGRYGGKAFGIFVWLGSHIWTLLQPGVANFGSTMMTSAFWFALLAGIGIGAVMFNQGSQISVVNKIF